MPAKARRSSKQGTDRRKPADDGRIEVRNVNVPGHVTRVDATKYRAVEKALLASLPKKEPGLTQAAMFEAVVERVPDTLFPGGAKVAWWTKCVQLDLEARRRMQRLPTKPLTWIRS